jgi:hypothetical protein
MDSGGVVAGGVLAPQQQPAERVVGVGHVVLAGAGDLHQPVIGVPIVIVIRAALEVAIKVDCP